ncbi:SOS response-associated peptidase [Clostridium sp. Cult1]|uniref:SOS response-associated peptidase n=1 Tax=Clostridium sp. Cult1 TaxID=2079002 RepID=UPI001F39C297|nr:SOS response-associated peptidase [Clostridium sp. Cult1]
MCGRFLLDSSIEEIIRTYRIYIREIDGFDKGDYYPSQKAPIIFEKKERTITLAQWGFPYGDKKGLVINGRAETIMDKPMFKNAFYSGRCIIPANLFYEWKDEGHRNKVKHKISLQDSSLILLGGIYKVSIDEDSNKQLIFVIITTEANGNMKTIHSRMPLLIKNDMVNTWLKNSTSVEVLKEVLKDNRDNKLIVERAEDESYQQLRMF